MEAGSPTGLGSNLWATNYRVCDFINSASAYGEHLLGAGRVLVTVGATVNTADKIPAILNFASQGAEAGHLGALSISFYVVQPLLFESPLCARSCAWQQRLSGNRTALVPAFMARMIL